MITAGCSDIVMEIPSRWIAEKKLAGFGLDVAIITNIRREHLKQHTTAANYVRAKLSVLDMLSETGIAILTQ